MTEPTRRRILELTLTAHAAAILEAQQHAHEAAKADETKSRAELQSFSAAEADEVAALAALIIPSGSTPGAAEAGAVYFIDKALATFDRDKRETYQNGLHMVRTRREELFPGSTSVARLAPGDQLRLAEAIEKTNFFEILRAHAVMAFLGRSELTGNKTPAGWTLIGFKE